MSTWFDYYVTQYFYPIDSSKHQVPVIPLQTGSSAAIQKVESITIPLQFWFHRSHTDPLPNIPDTVIEDCLRQRYNFTFNTFEE
jgi:hypothetical protein